ncbi:MAG: metallophosphoesterase [Candidatus Obscuribacter sp.]|nr:metallophosphoesterase [Candidatus Melainabacteria bacterium]MDX1990461.1 metallophosphoesterase [Candidatus Obscuribacter sp.]
MATGLGSVLPATASGSVPQVSFAYLEGAHLATGMPDNIRLLAESQLFLQNALKTINQEGVDFVLFGGDQVEGPGRDETHWQLFIDVAQVLNAPWYFIMGEQDISGPIPVDKMRTYGPDLKGRGLNSPDTYWSLDPVSGLHLIGLDTARANSNTGEIKSQQLEWLKEDLKKNSGKFTVVASHHPLLPPPPYDSGPPWEEYIVSQGAQAREILGSSRDVRLVLSGHVGANKIQKERDIWYVSCPSLAVYPCQFKIFRLSAGGILVETYQITYEALVKKAKKELASSRLAFQYSSRKPLTYLKIVEGEELDRQSYLPLAPGAVPLKPAKKAKKPKSNKKEKPPKAKPEPQEKIMKNSTKPTEPTATPENQVDLKSKMPKQSKDN